MARSATVLVVDDTAEGRYVVSRLLRGAGHAVLEAGTGAEALALAARRPDLVVLDVNLPDISGYEVVRRLKGDPATAGIPVLHLTASRVGGAEQAHGLEAGADAYLVHPVEPMVLLATVGSLLRAGAAEARARALAGAWQATFDAIAEPIVLLDAAGGVRQANAAARPLLDDPASLAHVRLLPAAVAAGARAVELTLGARRYRATVDRVPLPDGPEDALGAVVVLTDVTTRRAHEAERERLLEEAEGARRDAEQANRAKSEFLAVMSHELRTPLNAIGGYVELMELGIRGPVTDAQRADLERIRRSQLHLLSLINDVLNFAKLESGRVHFALEPVDVDDALRTAADFVAPQLRERRLRYDFQPCAPGLTVETDREKLQQIVLNLLSNAVKFTPPEGTIAVRSEARPGGAGVRVTVSDTGRGIPPEKRESVFEPFVQVSRTRVQNQEGIGLGLAISRDLARRLGGDLWVEEAEGGGARFVLELG